MPLSTDRSTLDRLNRELAELRRKEAAEHKKLATSEKKASSAIASAGRSNSTSSVKMYLSTADREGKAAQKAREAISDLSSKGARKAEESAKLQTKISQEENRQRVKERQAHSAQLESTEKQSRQLEGRISELEQQISQLLEGDARSARPFAPVPPVGQTEAYDVFLSHASEDKADFVRNLRELADSAGLRVWYDETHIGWGDSLRVKIDEGLRGSLFGLVVFSPAYFAKPWTNYELDALLARALDGNGRLLPIWHRVTKDDVMNFSPALASRKALLTSVFSTEDIVTELVKLRDIYREKLEAD